MRNGSMITETGFGEALKWYRTHHAELNTDGKLTQKRLADMLQERGFDVTQAALSQWEKMSRPPRISSDKDHERMQALADILGVELERLLQGVVAGDPERLNTAQGSTEDPLLTELHNLLDATWETLPAYLKLLLRETLVHAYDALDN